MYTGSTTGAISTRTRSDAALDAGLLRSDGCGVATVASQYQALLEKYAGVLFCYSVLLTVGSCRRTSS